MQHLESFAHAARARGSVSRPVVLFLLLAQVAAAGCQPELEPASPAPAPDSLRTSAHALAEVPVDEAVADADPSPPGRAYRGVLDPESLRGVVDLRYDAFVLTARETATVTLRSEVLKTDHAYPHGHGYPLSIAALEEGVNLTAIGGLYLQDALEDGKAEYQYPVVEGRQYILVYKTFGAFVPLTYRLRIPTALKLEGRIQSLPAPVPVPEGDRGHITLENPRPATLDRIVEWLGPRVGS